MADWYNMEGMSNTPPHIIPAAQTAIPTVGMGVTYCGWTDCEPFHIVKVHTDRKLTIRAADAVIDPTWKPDFQPGGFCGHVSNNSDQCWLVTPGKDGATERVIRLGKKGWKDPTGARYSVGHARKFHDYNF